MLKLIKNVDEVTKKCNEVFLGTNISWALEQGFYESECDLAYDGSYYLLGYVPAKPQSEINLERIAELKGLLSSTDYKAIKFAEGSLTEEEYAETRTERQSWRDEINQLEAESNE